MRLDPYVVQGVPRRYRLGMTLFWWYGVLISISSAFVDNFVTLFVLALGATSLQVGTLSSLSSFLGMLMPLPGAQWAARWGKLKPVVVISYGLRYGVLLLAALVPFVLSGSAAVYVIIGLFALRAAFLHLGNSPWTSLAGQIVPQNRWGRYFSSRKMVMALASLIFVPLAGQMIGVFPEPLGYQIGLGLAVVWGVLALIFFARIPEEAGKPATASGRTNFAFWRALSDNRAFWQFTLISMFFHFVWQFAGPYFGVYQVEGLGATSRVIGWLAIVSSLARMAGQAVWGRTVDQRGSQWVFTLCMLLIPIIPFIWLPLTAAWQVIFVNIPSGFLWAGQETGNFNLILGLAGKDGRTEEQKTQAIASYHTLVAIANILGPLAGGFVIEAIGYKWAFALSGFGRLAAAILFLMLLKPFDLRSLGRRKPVMP